MADADVLRNQMIAAAFLGGRMVSELLERMDYLIVGFGVQSVVGSKTRSDRYLGEITAAYIGAGDMYDDSVIYDAVARRFLVSSFAAFRAKFSRKYGI